MELGKIKLSLVITSILVITALVPIAQILVMLLNGGILYIFGDGSGQEIWVNIILALFGLMAFYKSKEKVRSIILAVVSIIFLLPLFIYLFENRVSDSPYFLQMLLAGLLTGMILTGVEFFKPNHA